MSDIFSNMPIPYSTPTQAKETTATQTTQPVVVKEAIPSSKVQEQQADSVEISSQNKEKKGPIKSIKGFIANIKKFFATTTEYAKGTVKGLTSGVVAGSVVYTAGSVINFAKQKAVSSGWPHGAVVGRFCLRCRGTTGISVKGVPEHSGLFFFFVAELGRYHTRQRTG